MNICNHYYYDDREKKNVSLVKPLAKHVYECKQCRVKLHDVDVQYLNDYLKYLNKEGNVDFLNQKADIYKQLKPIPREY